jgi:hypothetical protein
MDPNQKKGHVAFGVSASGGEMAIRQVLEPAMREVVDRTLQTFPEGPDAIL